MKIRHGLLIIKEEVEDKQLERRQWNWWYEEKEPIAHWQTVTTRISYPPIILNYQKKATLQS